MTNTSVLEKAAQRRIIAFERKYGPTLLHLACHAALPAALNADLVHLLRINFFFDNVEQLPYTAEADLLLSSLCVEIGDELYEMDHEVRNILLQKLTSQYGKERLNEVAELLWQYDKRYAPWSDREMLERAQQLTAVSFLDPSGAKQWLAQHSTDQHSIEQRAWFAAVNQDVLLVENVLLASTEQVKQQQVTEVQEVDAQENKLQTPTEGLVPLVIDYGSHEKQHQAPSETQIDRKVLREAIIDAFSLEELEMLCFDITHDLHNEGVNELISLDALEGRSLETKVLSLIDYCERRGWLEILIREVQRIRPNLQLTEQNLSTQEQESKESESADKRRYLNHEQIRRLIELSLQIPDFGNFATRSLPLAGIPNYHSLVRSHNPRHDISLLVENLQAMQLPNGQSALLTFIDNLIPLVEGTVISKQLKELRHEIEIYFQPKEQKSPSQEEPTKISISIQKEEQNTIEHEEHEVIFYTNESGRKPFTEWLDGLPDAGRRRIMRRVDRLKEGRYGDCQPVGEGVSELRDHTGPSYRVYFGTRENKIVVLLGSNRDSQKKDIIQAKDYWKDYKSHNKL